MQADEFEKKVQEKLESLELLPNEEVWKQVSIRMVEKNKKKRILFFWIFSGLLLLAGTSAYFIIKNDDNKKLPVSQINNELPKQKNFRKKQNSPNSSVSIKKVRKIHFKKSRFTRKKDDEKQLSALERKTSDLLKTGYVKAADQKLIPQEKEYSKVYKKEEKYAKKDLLSHKYYNPGATAKPGAAVKNNSTDKQTNGKKDSSANTTAKKINDKKTGKRWIMGFTVYSGISDNISGLLSTKAYMQNYLSLPVTSANGGNYTYEPNLSNSFTSAFSFGFGFFVKNQLTKKIGLSAGVDYHLYSAKSAVGKNVNSSTGFYDSESQTNTFASRYYTVGNSMKFANQYQFLELPINILFQLNKNVKKPLLLSAGISPGYLTASNALYANSSANVYYRDKEKFHHFMLSAQSGLSFPVFHSSKLLLMAGPTVQYGFTNVSKAAWASPQHLLFTGIKANIVFK